MRINETRPFEAWPGNMWWSFQFARIASSADFGGGSFAEAWEAAQLMNPGDPSSWFDEMYRIANVCEERGAACESLGNTVSARAFFQRASQYYKFAGIFSAPFDDLKVISQRRMRETFTRAAKWFDPPLERIEIDYEGHRLGGWFMKPNSGERHPVCFWVNGGDETPEENYFSVAKPLVEAGYAWMCFDQPGTGESLHELHLPVPYDSERFVTPAVDYLIGRPDVDPDGIILGGMSWGGHSAGRAAVFEKRLAALVLVPPVPDLKFFWAGNYFKETLAGGEHMMGLVGAKTEDELRECLARYDWNDLIPQIECPLLCLGAAEELLIPESLTQTARVFERAGSTTKRLVIIERGAQLAGVLHCHADNRHVFHEALLNWLIEIGLAPSRD